MVPRRCALRWGLALRGTIVKCSHLLHGNGTYGRTGLQSLDITLGGLRLLRQGKAARFSTSAASRSSDFSALCICLDEQL